MNKEIIVLKVWRYYMDDILFQIQVRVLFVRNMASQTSEEDLWNLFTNLSEGNVERVRKFDTFEARSYAFVHFMTREAAEQALAWDFWCFFPNKLKPCFDLSSEYKNKFLLVIF